MIDSLGKRFLLNVPEDDPETALSATIFNYVCLSVIAFLLVCGGASLFVFVRKTSACISTLALLFVLLIAVSLARRGRLMFGSAFLVIGLWVISTVQVGLSGGIDTIFASTYIAIIAIAGVLLGPSFAIIIAFLTAAAAFGMTSLQSVGYTLPRYYPMPPWSAWFMLLLPVLLIVAIINGALRVFTEAVKRANEELETRRKAERAVRESQQKLQTIFETSPAGMLLVDPEGLITFANRKMGDLFCRPCEGLPGTPYVDLVHPEQRSIGDAGMKALMAGEIDHVSLERRYQTADGREFLGHLSGRRLLRTDGSLDGLIGIITDITERKKMEKALRDSEERYRTVVEESFDGVFVQKGAVISFANSRLHEMLGYDRGELDGLDHWLIYHPDCRDLTRSRAQDRLREKSVPQRYEVSLLRKDGTAFPGEICAKVILLDNEPGIQVWIRDLTEQKLLEKRLVEAQKMESIGTLTGGIAHDFNNLLTIMNGYTELILSQETEKNPHYEDLKKILETGRKGADLVQRLLAFSQKAEIRPQPLDVNSVVENSIKLLERTFPKTIEIETILAKDLATVNADVSQVEQVLMNLCINAMEAMPEGGRLKIETGYTSIDEHYCRSHPVAKPGGHVLIEISDTGTGMNKEIMEKIFDPFFTTKGWDFNKGTGLGLSSARGIVEQHGGWITCESEKSKGTTFRVYFPAVDGPPTVGTAEPANEIVTSGEKILLVDDEELVRDLGKRILERGGYTTITTADGKEALEIYARERSNIALVVLDLVMPHMGGEKCLEELLKIDPHVKVIVSTGRSLDARERLHIGSRVCGFVSKPYQVSQMVKTVKGALEPGREPGQELNTLGDFDLIA